MKQVFWRAIAGLTLAILVALGAASGFSNAAPIDLATTPLATSTTGTQVQPNIMFILDDSGSMERAYVPDTVRPTTGDVQGGRTPTTSFTCRTDSKGINECTGGEPPWNSGQFNGLAYNPSISYKAALNFDGSSRGDQRAWTKVSEDNFASTKTYVDLTTQFPDVVYATGSGSAKRRKGIDNGARFAYATPPKPGLTGVQFSRVLSTVKGTTAAAHNVQVDDVIDVVGAGGCSATAVKVTTVPTATTFTFDYGDAQTQPTTCGVGSVNFSKVGYPEEGAARSFQTTAISIVPGQNRVTVIFPNHGLITGDLIDVTGGTNCNSRSAGALVTVVSAREFNFEPSAKTSPCGGTHIISRRLANIRSEVNGPPFYYTITPNEYCSDQHLSNCIAATTPTGPYTYAAYVRYCRTVADAQQPPRAPSAALPAGPAACIDKFLDPYFYPRYGTFTRGDIVPNKTYPRIKRADCQSKTECTYDEEMTNFANWFSYYRTRMQAMKSAAGIAFSNVDISYRVGFMTINVDSLAAASISSCAGSGFAPVKTFDLTQKQIFYCALYGKVPSGGTPLRQALSRVGRYFAHKTDGINAGIQDDPIQYSCQQNFAILTTDGQWKPHSFAPALTAGTNVGNVDGEAGRVKGLVSQAAGTYDGGCPDGDVDKDDGVEGCANTLSDVALYYYATDLRDAALGNTGGPLGTDVSTNNVATSPRDPATWQHMVTYGVGLADGVMTWQPDYDTATTGDFYSITSSQQGCFWSGTGVCKWPVPASTTPTAVDDLWHAAVNGHGRYFHATDPQSLANALTSSIAGIKSVTGSAAGAAVSSPNLTSESNFAFTSEYFTGDWSGRLFRRAVDLSTGEISATPTWKAHELLDTRDPATRNIFTLATASVVNVGPTGTKPFKYASFTAQEKAWLDNACAKLSQCPSMTPDGQAKVNRGETIVNFLSGSNVDAGTLLRAREHRLGDIVNATAAFVSAPRFNFADAVTRTYAEFKTTNASRRGMVYVGANDGMLHAFDAATGVEVWAYVPRMLISRLYQLADVAYAKNHAFFVDGTPSVMDVYDGNGWRTILVAGLNGGGKGFYALDITVPDSPTALWEFCADASLCDLSDPDLGYSYGNPVITKRNGAPVVLLTSGYNNASGSEFLYVVNLFSKQIEKIPTNYGTLANPGGLAKIAAYADNFQLDNTAKYVYGGDLAGNVWRFDLTGTSASVIQLATLTDSTGKRQPVTTRPELGFIRSNRVLFIGTGRYLGVSDMLDRSSQSLYAFKDMGAPLVGELRNLNMVQRTLLPGDTTRTIAAGAIVNWGSQNGWFVDFNPGNTSPGERVNIEPQLTLGTLTVHTNVPGSDACKPGGDSWLYEFGYENGTYVPGVAGQIVGRKVPGGLTVGFAIFHLPNGSMKELLTTGPGDTKPFDVPTNSSTGLGRRVGWRELTR